MFQLRNGFTPNAIVCLILCFGILILPQFGNAKCGIKSISILHNETYNGFEFTNSSFELFHPCLKEPERQFNIAIHFGLIKPLIETCTSQSNDVITRSQIIILPERSVANYKHMRTVNAGTAAQRSRNPNIVRESSLSHNY